MSDPHHSYPEPDKKKVLRYARNSLAERVQETCGLVPPFDPALRRAIDRFAEKLAEQKCVVIIRRAGKLPTFAVLEGVQL